MSERIENRMVVDSEWEKPYKEVARCSECDCDIYQGEYFFNINGDIVCESCIRDYVKNNYRRCIDG